KKLIELAHLCITKKLSVRDLELLVRKMAKPTKSTKKDEQSLELKEFANTLNKGLFNASKGANKLVNFGKQVKGKITKEEVELNEFNGEKAPQISEKTAKAIIGGAIAFPIGILDKVIIGSVVSGVNRAKNKNEIKDQIYRFAILEFYSNSLSKFMELD
ncbi:MAG: hypothetical protein J1E36_02950, partial [Eubacterium sp.]|nr:hypothetical protein [Eubacterium sp.]